MHWIIQKTKGGWLITKTVTGFEPEIRKAMDLESAEFIPFAGWGPEYRIGAKLYEIVGPDPVYDKAKQEEKEQEEKEKEEGGKSDD